MGGDSKKGFSIKYSLIDKANQKIVVMTSIAVASLIFALFGVSSLVRQALFNGRVMNEKRAALKTLKTNKANIDTLVSSYGSFANEDVNILGGSKSGSATRDGDNSRIVLDALPSQYDFPAFVTSIEKLVQSQGGVTISALGGTDNSTSSASNAAQPALASATPVELKVPLSVTGDYTKIQAFIKTLESSIRPLYVNNLRLSGSDSSMTLNTDLTTYYQPEARFDVTTKVVK